VTGSLTLRGTTRPVVLDVQRSTADGSRASAHASTTIDRRDFGITYSGYAVGKHGDLLAVVAVELRRTMLPARVRSNDPRTCRHVGKLQTRRHRRSAPGTGPRHDSRCDEAFGGPRLPAAMAR
jgi:YceI-like domain